MHVFVNRQKDVWDSIIERRGHVHWHSQISKLNPRIHQCHFIWNAELNSNNTNTHCSKMADIMRLLDLISPLDTLQNKFVLLFTILKSVYLCNSLFTVKQDTFFRPSYCCLEWNYFSAVEVGSWQGASCQASAHLAKRFQRGRFLEQPDTRIAYGGHVCYQIGTKWAILLEDLP